ncbi:MAG TPA: iron-sulfur cluster assembly accessory protein [Fimbriimonadaceae bacterium]|nr:iron-sulfur cluster assembly accessory protein [Fimbriimonadaceae bacterium]
MSQFPVALTERSVVQAKRVLQKEGKEGLFLRIGVKGGGCSGLEYVMRTDTSRRESDLVLELDGLTVICDPKSAAYLEGATLDYTGNLIGGGFQFENPNADRSCGCGTSFMPKPRS